MRFLFCLAVLLRVSCLAQDSLTQGVEHFKSAQYPEAANDFRSAVKSDPNNITAQLYLATALEMQYVPGLDTPANVQFATDAFTEFRKVLDKDPSNVLAIQSIASLYYNEKKFAEAADWNKKVIAMDPNNKEAYYTLGVLAWSTWLPVDRQARIDSKQRPEDPGPIANVQIREGLKAQWLPILDEGIRDIRHALQISPTYDDAMVYMNLLIRYRADLDNTTEQWKADIDRADMWMRKAIEAKNGGAIPRTLSPANVTPQGGVVAGFPGGVLGGIIGSLPGPPSSQPGSIRIGSKVSTANLIRKVTAVYPPLARQARISGTVHLNVTIDKEGHVENLTLISGHPLLVQAAMDAVQGWVYKPTLLNGNPVKVLTTVDVNFTLSE